ncbi:MAG: sodium:proton antiporter NhaD [Bacteroidota bacterium]
MYILMIVAFVVGYFFIAMEHPFKIDKAASAVLTGVICWTLLVLGQEAIFAGVSAEALHGHTDLAHFLEFSLLEHLGEIAEILFFLLGAMTIVELVDAHKGFAVITDRIKTTDKVRLLWIISIVTFFFSPVLDNLTTSIVIAVLLRKLIRDKEDLWFFAGMVIIAANAGGAWSPIGDVTTIMLWIGGQVTAGNIILKVFFPGVVNLLVPLIIASFMLKGNVERPRAGEIDEGLKFPVTTREQNLIFWMGVLGLLFVPFFKTYTHLPPYMGMLFSLGVIWVTTEIIHRNKDHEIKSHLSVTGVITKVDTPSILFFLGILLAVAALQTAGHLTAMAGIIDETFKGNIYAINTLIGLLSSIVDNVPIVAAAMGMYPIEAYATDHPFWELLAYCAGTGGSALIIGSAAGVAIMGILKIDFIWYLKRISLLALSGYFAGIGVYWLQEMLIG